MALDRLDIANIMPGRNGLIYCISSISIFIRYYISKSSIYETIDITGFDLLDEPPDEEDEGDKEQI